MADRRSHSFRLRQRVALASRILAMEGMGDATLGHVSARIPRSNAFWVKRAAIGLEEVSSRDLMMVSLDGRKLAGKGRLHLEIPLHSEIYRVRPDVGSVVHAHPLHATLVGSSGKRLRPITHEGTLFTDTPRFASTTNIIANPRLGKAVSRTLGSHQALFLRNHGIVVVGKDPEEACVLTILLEKACRTQLLATSLGGYSWSRAKEIKTKLTQIYHRQALLSMWEYYLRKLKRQERIRQ